MTTQLKTPGPAEVLAAMRATEIPNQRTGLWSIERISVGPDVLRSDQWPRDPVVPGTYVALRRATASTLHVGGETVMIDTEPELRKHLEFVYTARGDVLVTGLGLGCVVRGLALNPAVATVTVIEIDPEIIRLVAPYVPGWVEIVHADALDWIPRAGRRFYYAWHDIWSDEANGEPPLALLHAQLITVTYLHAGGCRR